MDSGFILTLVIVAGSLVFSLIMFGGMAYFFWKFFKKMNQSAQIRQNGIAATAQINQLSDTGMTINDSPQVALVLTVQSPHHGTYQVQTKALISRLAIPRVQPGATVPVKIDPTNPQNVVLDL